MEYGFNPLYAIIEVGTIMDDRVERFLQEAKIYAYDIYYYPPEIDPEDLEIEVEDLKPFYTGVKVFVGGDKKND